MAKSDKPAVRSGSQKPTREDLRSAYQRGYLYGLYAAKKQKSVYRESSRSKRGFRDGHAAGVRTLRIKNKVERYRQNLDWGGNNDE